MNWKSSELKSFMKLAELDTGLTDTKEDTGAITSRDPSQVRVKSKTLAQGG